MKLSMWSSYYIELSPEDAVLELEKYGYKYSELSDEDTEIYETFVHGLHNADKALGKLIEYFSAVDEPVVIAFWGDHLPNLTTSSGSNIYREVGFCDDSESYNLESSDYFKMLITDYVIWNNFGLEKKEKAIGAPMFGIEVMDRIGIEKLETEMPFFREGYKLKEKDRQEMLRIQDTQPTDFPSLQQDFFRCIWQEMQAAVHMHLHADHA